MLKQNLFEPLGRRAGSALAGYLVGQGMPQELEAQVTLVVAAVVAVAVDLVLSYIDRKAAR